MGHRRRGVGVVLPIMHTAAEVDVVVVRGITVARKAGAVRMSVLRIE